MSYVLSGDERITDIPSIVLDEVARGCVDPKHPFRYMILSTFGDDFPECRYVVLRRLIREAGEILCYTDRRSQKVRELDRNPNCSLLFYHDRKKFQVRARAKATIFYQGELVQDCWENVGRSKADYNTLQAPGLIADSPIKAFEQKEILNEEFFSVLSLKLIEIDVLQLRREGHLRAKYDFNEKLGSWLVP